MSAQDFRYPIGKFEWGGSASEAQRQGCIDEIAVAPARLRAAVAGLSPAQLATPYREGGWTVRQVVHHVPDSHMNAYTRFKLALTEEEPTITPYNEARWAELADSRLTPLETSLALLDSVHERWSVLLRCLTPSDFSRRYRHPERGVMTLEETLAHYAWHGRHHVAHITSLRDRMRWG